MKREIKFKGIRKSNGKQWISGSGICKEGKIVKILVNTQKDLNRDPIYKWVTVIPETVCQLTGLKDKNGSEIFEGDEIRILYTDWISQCENDIRTLEQYKIDMSSIGIVKFTYCEFGIDICSDSLDSLYEGVHGEKELTGKNIHDKK